MVSCYAASHTSRMRFVSPLPLLPRWPLIIYLAGDAREAAWHRAAVLDARRAHVHRAHARLPRRRACTAAYRRVGSSCVGPSQPQSER